VKPPRREERTAQFNMLLPYLADLPLRDQREMMERPFFSLAKSKRVKPIDYSSPDGKLWVHVSANPDYGMATIWDADILIYCASMLADMARRGVNDVPRTLHLMPYDLLRAIGRQPTGRAYELLGQALDRLVATTVKTNIRAGGPGGGPGSGAGSGAGGTGSSRREATFSWLDGWTQLVDDKTERPRGMTIELSNWFHEGVMMTGGVLSIDRAYFHITGGRERWLYKVARKHAGGAGEEGFAISMPTLFEKSGAEGQYRRFKFEIARIAARDELPGYALSLETAAGRDEPSLRMRRRGPGAATDDPPCRPLDDRRGDRTGDPVTEPADGSAGDPPIPAPPPPAEAPVAMPDPGSVSVPPPVPPDATVDARALIRRSVTGLATRARAGEITEQTLATLRAECPGWDYQTLHADFRRWIDGDPDRTPVSYQNAFIGYVRRFDAKNRHILGR